MIFFINSLWAGIVICQPGHPKTKLRHWLLDTKFCRTGNDSEMTHDRPTRRPDCIYCTSLMYKAVLSMNSANIAQSLCEYARFIWHSLQLLSIFPYNIIVACRNINWPYSNTNFRAVNGRPCNSYHNDFQSASKQLTIKLPTVTRDVVTSVNTRILSQYARTQDAKFFW
jgi:hypothetical protein